MRLIAPCSDAKSLHVARAHHRTARLRGARRRELNAFTYLDPRFEAGVEQAVTEEAATDVPADTGGPSHAGYPMPVKNGIEVTGMPCTLATPAVRKCVANHDAPVLSRLRGPRAETVGKANMPEMAYGITSNSPISARFAMCTIQAASPAAAAVPAPRARGTRRSRRRHRRLLAPSGGAERHRRIQSCGSAALSWRARLSPARDVTGSMKRTVPDVARPRQGSRRNAPG